MGAHYDHLTLEDRRLIYRLREAKVSVPAIARRPGRHRSTIHREIRPNWFDDGPYLSGYFPISAQERTARRRRWLGKLYRESALRDHVIARLKDAWSPEQIAGRLKLDGATLRVSHETVYQYVFGAGGRQAELYRLLPRDRSLFRQVLGTPRIRCDEGRRCEDHSENRSIGIGHWRSSVGPTLGRTPFYEGLDWGVPRIDFPTV